MLTRSWPLVFPQKKTFASKKLILFYFLKVCRCSQHVFKGGKPFKVDLKFKIELNALTGWPQNFLKCLNFKFLGCTVNLNGYYEYTCILLRKGYVIITFIKITNLLRF